MDHWRREVHGLSQKDINNDSYIFLVFLLQNFPFSQNGLLDSVDSWDSGSNSWSSQGVITLANGITFTLVGMLTM